MNKKMFFIGLLLFFASEMFSQDVDFYIKNQNDNFDFQKMPKEMSFDEYNILSQSFRMQDMMFGFFVPGYVHFKANDKKTGYALVTLSSLSYATFAYQLVWSKNNLSDSSFFYNLNNLSSLSSDLKTNTLIMGGALFTIGSSYLFDIIHGKYRLQKKQNAIRYKYSLKASLSDAYIPNKYSNIACFFSMKIYF
ncbi:MAG: hypothetical protein JXR68_01135 [Bacteroidales bacterium]|nr:hypothetical protein [Bacteroidales bacterium]